MTALQDLHTLVDWLPECARGEAHQILLAHLKKCDPVAYALFTAPEDDEPETEAERAAMAEVYADIREGRGYWVSHEEVKTRMARLS